jgi:hypothetical protein
VRTLHTLLSLWWWIKAPKYQYLASKPWERSHKVFIFFLTDKGDDANDTVLAPSIGQSPCIRPSCCCTNLDEAKAFCMCASYWCPSSHQMVPLWKFNTRLSCCKAASPHLLSQTKWQDNSHQANKLLCAPPQISVQIRGRGTITSTSTLISSDLTWLHVGRDGEQTEGF